VRAWLKPRSEMKGIGSKLIQGYSLATLLPPTREWEVVAEQNENCVVHVLFLYASLNRPTKQIVWWVKVGVGLLTGE